jgi:hypothetical protein
MSTITLRSAKGSPLTNTEVDNNFANLNEDKYEAGNSVEFDDATLTGNLKQSISASVTAAGTTQADATALTNDRSIVTTVSSGQGVKLPSAAAALAFTVVNTTSTSLKVYPDTGDAVNGQSVNTPITMSAYTTSTFIAKDTTNWYTNVPLVIYDADGNRLN